MQGGALQGASFDSLRQRCLHDHLLGATLAQLQQQAPQLFG